MKRSKHSLSHYKLLSFDMGELVPVACYEVLPGDSVQQASSALVRVSPLARPVMHPVTVRIHHWFVPYRLVWEDFEAFITGGKDGEGDGSVFPTIDPGGGGFAAGQVADYLGVPPDVADLTISALPLRAYALIFNEYYRDQDLVLEAPLSVASGVDVTTTEALRKIAWEKDYFTSARPWPQKGPDVTLPLGVTAPVETTSQNILLKGAVSQTDQLFRADSADAAPGAGGARTNINAGIAGLENLQFGSITGLQANLATATAVNVNDVREAFALQRYQEARAIFGSRYTEYLRYLGVRSSDARLQRPEYLGGGKQTIAFTEVLQTAPTTSGDDAGVADMKGHGISAMRSRRFRRFFEEHGIVLSLMSVRPRTMYGQYFPRMWSRRTKEDFFQKELEQIGQQEVFRREVFADRDAVDGGSGDTVFGYQDRYAEYRHEQSTISGEFRTSLNDWHMARLLAGPATLNSAFVTCDPTKRIHLDQTTDVLWCMVNNSIQARRPVSKRVVGRIF